MIIMKSYSYTIKENKESYAAARIEGVDASFKDLAQVCGRVRTLHTERAMDLLEGFSLGELPVLYKSHNKRLGHRKELGGQKGRYPKKAARIVFKLLQSAIANATLKGMIEPYVIVHVAANKKRNYPRSVPKGRRGRSDYETARVEIVIREKEIVKKEKKEVPKKDITEEKKTEGTVEKNKTDANKIEVKKQKEQVKAVEEGQKETTKKEVKTKTEEKKVEEKEVPKKTGEK